VHVIKTPLHLHMADISKRFEQEGCAWFRIEGELREIDNLSASQDNF